MEDVLDLYHRPRDRARPLVCLDELPVQFHGEVAAPLPVRSGDTAKEDYEYIRNGSGSAFLALSPLEGERLTYVSPEATRTAVDYAEFLRMISEEWFPEADRIVLVQDNLNTHTPASLYKAFPPEEARRLARRFEVHYTPKHGSWLNVAESEISVLSRQCLSRRIPDKDTLRAEVAAWEKRRNESAKETNWQFTSEDARIKLKKLYPSF
jgi:hypothetical protein